MRMLADCLGSSLGSLLELIPGNIAKLKTLVYLKVDLLLRETIQDCLLFEDGTTVCYEFARLPLLMATSRPAVRAVADHHLYVA